VFRQQSVVESANNPRSGGEVGLLSLFPNRPSAAKLPMFSPDESCSETETMTSHDSHHLLNNSINLGSRSFGLYWATKDLDHVR